MASEPLGRSYGDPCGVARALDIVGERWALLVVRELLLGPKRFTDLYAGLAGISQNVLSQRLRELERSGVLVRQRLAPPARVWTYALTERGTALEPVLIALGRWGRDVPFAKEAALSPDALLLALRTTFSSELAGRLRLTAQLRMDDDEVSLTVADGRLTIARAPAGDAAIRIEADSATVRALAFRRAGVAEMMAAGRLRVEGSVTHVERLFGLFAPTGTAAR